MRQQTLLNHITGIIAGFDFSVPLHHFLKNYFRQHKQLGSRDRKIISSGCYAYYRCALLMPNKSFEEQLALSFFITNETNLLSEYLFEKYRISKKEYNCLSDRLWFIQQQGGIPPDEAFLFLDLLPEEIDKKLFTESLFQQPLVWIRIRNGFEKSVLDELKLKEVTPVKSIRNALSFAPAAPLTTLDAYMKGYFEIQDLSSQQTLSLLPDNCGQRMWDCCSGSGGKTLLLADRFPNASFLLTDLRTTSLQNAEVRLNKAAFRNYKTLQADLTGDLNLGEKFNVIIADVPCSGSGTWSRTPENFWNFDKKKIKDYTELQLTIAKNATKHLNNNGIFLYLTCSAFVDENEENVKRIAKQCNLNIVEQTLFHGYKHQSDTMFSCLMKLNG